MQPGSRILEKAILSYIDGLVNIIIELSIKTGEHKKLLFDQAVNLVHELSPLLLNLAGAREEHLEALIRQLVTQKLPQGPALKSFGDLHQDLNCILAAAFHPVCTSPAGNDPEEELSAGENPDLPKPEAGPEVEEEISSVDLADEPVAEQVVEVVEPIIEEASEPVFEPVIEAVVEQSEVKAPAVMEKVVGVEQILRQVYPGEEIQRDYYFRGLCFSYYLPRQKLGILINLTLSQRHPAFYKNLLQKESIRIVEFAPRELESPALLLRRLPRL